jgi:hypothetical protein
MQMGGTNRSASYQTQMPNYTDLKSKHTAGVQDPATNDRTQPSLFSFNGTVYQYEPEGDAYRDTYTGQLITADNGVLGSRGIAGLYNDYVPTASTDGSDSNGGFGGRIPEYVGSLVGKIGGRGGNNGGNSGGGRGGNSGDQSAHLLDPAIDYTNEKRINPEYEAYMAKYGGGGTNEAPATKPDNMNNIAYTRWKTTGIEPPPRSRGGGRYDPNWGYYVD